LDYLLVMLLLFGKPPRILGEIKVRDLIASSDQRTFLQNFILTFLTFVFRKFLKTLFRQVASDSGYYFWKST
jgi:hypothetical protein